MKICVAQTRPVKGDIRSNIAHHLKLTDLALSHGADTVIFPELSITGYEPALAQELATDPGDRRFDVFQHLSDARQITIGVGVPTKTPAGICIGMVLFGPHLPRQTYFKKYLHSDEEPFFTGGQNASVVIAGKPDIALSICYELSVPQHAEDAHKSGASIYIASVAKSVAGVEKAHQRLSEIAGNYAMTVLMANCVGPADGTECGGKTSAWDTEGTLAGQLDGTSEGILLIDTDTREIVARTL